MSITQATAVCFILTAILVINSQYPTWEISGAGFGGGPRISDGTSNTFEKAPVFTSDGNVYVIWWSNKTGNNEVMFRASNDAGLTFGDKINLSNTSDIESVDAEIAADDENVYVTWWERNENVHPHTNEPVLRISNDAGQTFGPVLQLSQNGTLGSTGDSEEGQ